MDATSDPRTAAHARGFLALVAALRRPGDDDFILLSRATTSGLPMTAKALEGIRAETTLPKPEELSGFLAACGLPPAAWAPWLDTLQRFRDETVRYATTINVLKAVLGVVRAARPHLDAAPAVLAVAARQLLTLQARLDEALATARRDRPGVEAAMMFYQRGVPSYGEIWRQRAAFRKPGLPAGAADLSRELAARCARAFVPARDALDALCRAFDGEPVIAGVARIRTDLDEFLAAVPAEEPAAVSVAARTLPVTLDPGQLAALPRLAGPWLAMTRLDVPIDRVSAEAVMAEVYEFRDLPLPPIRWVDSPAAAERLLAEVDAGPSLSVSDGRPAPSVTAFADAPALPPAVWPASDPDWDLADQADVTSLQNLADALDLLLFDAYAPPVEGAHGYWVASVLADSVHRLIGPATRTPPAYAAWLTTFWLSYHDLARDLDLVRYDYGADAALDLAIEVGRTGIGWWWPYRDLCVISRRPVAMATEEMTGRERGRRLHRADGPVLEFADGTRYHAWHGTPVPADLVEGGWSVARILSEPNLELRRCAIERRGWPEFIDEAGLRQVGRPAPDPGNPGQMLTLYDVPWGGRILLCTNASLERDGTRRRYGIEVRRSADDPVDAAAGLFGLSREHYLTMQRAT
ncbi:DUF6745 domain-containing protein [Actinoplanes sp. CA-252034]|uniref:DUF6745 domain-containing protein n=1 Tax=Actinoplanes sp. CA-252034 TaxID=3239906 RepID=UPI003D984538